MSYKDTYKDFNDLSKEEKRLIIEEYKEKEQ